MTKQKPETVTYVFDNKGRRGYTRDGEKRGGGRRDSCRGRAIPSP